MKHKTPGVTDELLHRAKEEFLKEGYLGANLRRIAAAAGVSTNSIYGRFSDKKGLFDAIVKDTADQFLSMLIEMNKITETDIDQETAMEQSGQYTLEALDFVYDHFDEFKLIFCKSSGTEYEYYIDQLSKEEEKAYKIYFDKLGINNKELDLFIHVVCQTGYIYITEAVAHDLTREEARRLMKKVITYTDAGLEAVLRQ